MKLVNYENMGNKSTDVFKKVTLEEAKEFDDYLKYELIYWGGYASDYGVTKLTKKYIKQNGDAILEENSEPGQDETKYINYLYYIDTDTAEGKEKAYLYDERVDQVYKIDLTKIGRFKVHSIEELDYQKGNGTGERDIKEGTLIEGECNLVTVGNVTCYEPDLNGFVKEKTSAVYYKVDEQEDIINSEAPEEISITEYLGSKNRTIEKDSSTYVFYNYKETIEDEETGNVNYNSIWANIKVVNNQGTPTITEDDIETWWVWIPRYAYKIEGTKTYIKYIDVNNNIAGTDTPIDSNYIVHPAFTENSKKGIWVTKYEVNQVANPAVGDFPYYIPDVSGFDKEKTYLEVYKDDGTFEHKPLKEISNVIKFASENKWFDYEKQIWANIKVVNENNPDDPDDDIETWWVWIPRYAYSITANTTSIIFLDTNNKPLSGDELQSNYVVHPAFTLKETINNQEKITELKGIWVSKYEISQNVISTMEKTTVNLPDMSRFDPNKTWLEVYNDDGTFTQTKLKDVTNLEQFASENRWYDYSNQIWANIKVVNDQGTPNNTSDDVETWWVWIPRYAYNILNNETKIIFLDENGNPTDGSTLPSNYIPHPAFTITEQIDGVDTVTQLKGIWASKYEMSNK